MEEGEATGSLGTSTDHYEDPLLLHFLLLRGKKRLFWAFRLFSEQGAQRDPRDM